MIPKGIKPKGYNVERRNAESWDLRFFIMTCFAVLGAFFDNRDLPVGNRFFEHFM